jgi:type I restriction enzyme M protein
VSIAEIQENDFNLNIPRYIDSQEAEDIQDIQAHLLGGIPENDIQALGEFWQVYPNLQQELFAPTQKPGYQQLKVAANDVKNCIFHHPEFIQYSYEIEQVFTTWEKHHTPLLKAIQPGDKPKDIIYKLGENLLAAFTGQKLIDKYDVYQYLLTYWLEVMRDDVYMIVEDGWKAELTPITNKKGVTIDYVCELIPEDLIINNYFATEQGKIAQLENQKDDIIRQQEEMQEEYAGDEGLLEEVTNDSGKITKTNINVRIKEIQKNPLFADAEELQVLKSYLQLIESEAILNKKIKDATQELHNKVLRKYQELTEEEVKTLVVDDKWMRTLKQGINAEMDRISQRLTQRIKELGERYDTPLFELSDEVDRLTSLVDQHLQKMGFVW